MLAGVDAGSAVQSGSRSRTATIVSEDVSPWNAMRPVSISPDSEASPPAAVAAEAITTASAAETAPAAENTTASDAAPASAQLSEVAASVVAFTPVKTKQSALANAVAKEVASTLFPRSVLVGIILIQAAVIVWLLLRH